jgi:hypothetical protein
MEKCPCGSRSETRISGGISVEEINAPDPNDTISSAHLIHLRCPPSSGEVIPVLLVDRPADASCASRGDSRSPTANREYTTGGRGVGDAPNRPGHFQNACHPFAEEWSVMTTTIPNTGAQADGGLPSSRDCRNHPPNPPSTARGVVLPWANSPAQSTHPRRFPTQRTGEWTELRAEWIILRRGS